MGPVNLDLGTTFLPIGAMKLPRLLLTLACLTGFAGILPAADYHLGPDQAIQDPAQIPWQTLMPGDTVYFHARKEPYLTKFVLARRGEPGKPIRVVGVADAATGKLPVIQGTNAIVPPGLNYTSADRAVIKIGSARFHGAAEAPGYLELENLDIAGARAEAPFTQQDGTSAKYRVNAAAVHIESGDHITLRNCTLRDSSQGLSSAYQSTDVLVERCLIYNNGNPKSISEHNVYTESRGLTFLYNRLGPLAEGSLGNNIKDRSAGLALGWNWLEGGNRILDLVDTTHPELAEAPEYKHVYVFGNIMIKLDGGTADREEEEKDPVEERRRRRELGLDKDASLPPPPPPLENNQIIHYGGDSENFPMYRTGVLWFEHNTVVSKRNGSTVAFRLSTPKQFVVATNNLWSVGDDEHNRLYLLNQEGTVYLAGPNYAPTGWRDFSGELNPQIHVIGRQNMITTPHPQFGDEEAGDYRLQMHIKAVGKAGPPLLPLMRWPVASRIYKIHQGYEDLPQPNMNLGALPSTKSRSILGP